MLNCPNNNKEYIEIIWKKANQYCFQTLVTHEHEVPAGSINYFAIVLVTLVVQMGNRLKGKKRSLK